VTWWKQAAKHWLAPVAVLVVVGGCGGETPTATALPSVPVKPAPLPETSEVQDPTTGLALTGVLLVGDQKRAIVTTPNGSGVICVGADGRCGADAPLLLPTGWSVLSIDVEHGCIRLSLNDEPQDPFCMA